MTRVRRRKRRLRLSALTLLTALAALLALSCSVATAISQLRRAAPEDSETEMTLTEAQLPEGDWTLQDMTQAQQAQGDLVLVNAAHSYDPDTAPVRSVLYDVKSEHYYTRDTLFEVAQEIVDPLNRWMEDFYEKTKLDDINIVAGYRTYDEQQSLYDNALTTRGYDYAEQYLAHPGCSEHHTGLAVDLDTYDLSTGTAGGFDGTGAYSWLVENAWRYGFVQRYPPDKADVTGISYEAWHFRYVGLPHARLMYEQDLCLEEYIAYCQQYPFTGEHLYTECDGTQYEIYYCPGTQVYLPANTPCTVSGTNEGGFIVTIASSN